MVEWIIKAHSRKFAYYTQNESRRLSCIYPIFRFNVALYPFRINSSALQKMILLQLKQGNNWRIVWICSYKQDGKDWCKDKTCVSLIKLREKKREDLLRW